MEPTAPSSRQRPCKHRALVLSIVGRGSLKFGALFSLHHHFTTTSPPLHHHFTTTSCWHGIVLRAKRKFGGSTAEKKTQKILIVDFVKSLKGLQLILNCGVCGGGGGGAMPSLTM